MPSDDKTNCRITEKNTGMVFFSEARFARSFYERLMGLMFKKRISAEEAVIFSHAPCIHTCFMRFAIDVIFLDNTLRVVRVAAYVKPWRIILCANAAYTIECGGGTASHKKIIENTMVGIDEKHTNK